MCVLASVCFIDRGVDRVVIMCVVRDVCVGSVSWWCVGMKLGVAGDDEVIVRLHLSQRERQQG